MTGLTARANDALRWLEERGSQENREGMARYAIVAEQVFGVSVADIRVLAKELGRDHDLALELWKTGWYEARMLTAFVDEPAQVTSAQMDAWVTDFDNWAICDTLCFHLFDRTPHALAKVEQWSTRKEEFVRRAAFALTAGLALHDKQLEDAAFVDCLPFIERAAIDERNFVKKGVSWALRSIGQRNRALHRAALDVAHTLERSEDPTARWIARDVLKDLMRPTVAARLDKRSERKSAGGARRKREAQGAGGGARDSQPRSRGKAGSKPRAQRPNRRGRGRP